MINWLIEKGIYDYENRTKDELLGIARNKPPQKYEVKITRFINSNTQRNRAACFVSGASSFY